MTTGGAALPPPAGSTGVGVVTVVNNKQARHHFHQARQPPPPPQQSSLASSGGGNGGISLAAAVKHDAPKLCLAIICENGTDLVLLDASGKPRTFRYTGDVRSLCFASHGCTTASLTHCLDEHGNHGLPAADCFCGVLTPHVHAHVSNSTNCQDTHHDHGDCCSANSESTIQLPHDHDEQEECPPDCHGRSTLDCMSALASQILHPVDDDRDNDHGDRDDDDDDDDDDTEHREECVRQNPLIKLLTVPVSATSTVASPASSSDAPRRDGKTAPTTQPSSSSCASSSSSSTGNQKRRSSKVAKRSFRQAGSTDEIQVHFFEEGDHPFSVVEYLRTVFSLHSTDRVHAIEHLYDSLQQQQPSPSRPSSPKQQQVVEPQQVIVRSTLRCGGICCSSEVPAIRYILRPMSGVKSVKINVPMKQVLVQHDASSVSAEELTAALNRNRFEASVLQDGAPPRKPPAMLRTTTTALSAATKEKDNKGAVGRSQFWIQNICCSSEIPAINSIVKPLDGVSQVSINVTTKMVYVDHKVAILSAAEIQNALNQRGFGAEIRQDGGATAAAQATSSALVQSKLTILPTANDDKGGAAAAAAATKTDRTQQLTAFLRTVDSSQIQSFVVDLTTKSIQVVHNPFALSAEDIAALLEERTGVQTAVAENGADPAKWAYRARPPSNEAAAASAGAQDQQQYDEEAFTYPKPTVIASGIFWIVSMFSYFGGYWTYLEYVALLSVVFGLPPIAEKAFQTLKRYQLDTNCLMLFAAVGALLLREYTEAAAVAFLFCSSEWLEVRATTRARTALSTIVHLRPETARMRHPHTKEFVVVPANDVPVGAVVSVQAGDKIPCDGVVIEAGQAAAVDESSLTGESRPISKQTGDMVSGGTVNSGLSSFLVRTTATVEHSAVSRLIRLVEEAQANRSATEKLVDAFAMVYTPVVVLSAVAMCTVPWLFGKQVGMAWTHCGLILIVVACPCALVISTPVSYVAGLAATAHAGILIKGGAHLEALGMVRHVCFDKTGTLTNGTFALLHLKHITNNQKDSLSRERVLQHLALMEERASHPLAQAILVGVKNEGVVIPKDWTVEKHVILNGEGVSGVVQGRAVYVGNARLFDRLGFLESVPQQVRREVESWEAGAGGTVGYMSIEGQGIVCAYSVADGVRPESAQVIQKLRQRGIRVTMLTGDNPHAAAAVGKQVGLSRDEIKAKLLPEEKLNLIKSLSVGRRRRGGGQEEEEQEGEEDSILSSLWKKKKGLVLMCGDGVNDAPALAAADVGVAMGAGAALAMETADATLLDSNLEKLDRAVRMGRAVIAKIWQNVIFSLAVKLLVLALALAGWASLWGAIASDVGAMILVTLNSMLLLPPRKPDAELCAVATSKTTRGEDVEEGIPTETTGLLASKEEKKSGKYGGMHAHDHGHSHGHSNHSNTGRAGAAGEAMGAHGGCSGNHDHSHSHAQGGSHGHSHAHAVNNNHDHAPRSADSGAASHTHSHDHEHPDGHNHDHGHNHDYSHPGDHGHDHGHDSCSGYSQIGRAPRGQANHNHAHDDHESKLACNKTRQEPEHLSNGKGHSHAHDH